MFEFNEAESIKDHAQIITSSFDGRQPRIYQVTEGLKTPRTINTYRNSFKHFLDYIKIHDLQILLDYNPKVIESFIIDYVRHLRDVNQLKHKSIQAELSAIFHFFEMNDFDGLSTNSKKKIKRFLPSDDSTHDDRPYTTEEIGKILSKCDERSKVIILLMASTGMRIGAIHTLQIGHLKEVTFQNSKLYRVRVYAGTHDKYFTFCTPECYNAIQEYLQTRKRFGEEIKDKSPLIREQFNVDDKLRIQYPKPVSHKMIIYLVDQALIRSGVKTKEAMSSHAFRKGFKSICEQSGMRSINIEMLLGHDIGLGNNYYRPAESDLLSDFMAHAADALTISEEYRLKKRNQELETGQTQEIDKLKMQLDEKDRQLRQTVEALEIKSKNSIDKIEKQIIKLNNFMVEVTTDNEHGGTHYVKYKDLNGNELPRDKDKIMI